MKPQVNRRKFVALLAAGSAGGILVPTLLKGWGSSSPPALLPYVSETAYYGIIENQDGSFSLPAGCPVGYHPINETPIGGINTVYPVQADGQPVPLQYQQAFDYYALNNPPTGFSSATPQVAILEVLIGVAVLAAGGYVCYKIYKWASQLPPPDTNVYR